MTVWVNDEGSVLECDKCHDQNENCCEQPMACETVGLHVCISVAGCASSVSRLNWMRTTFGMPWPSVSRCEFNVCAEAAKAGHLDVLKSARAQGCPWDASTCIAAAQHGHLHILRWARRQGCPWGLAHGEFGRRGEFHYVSEDGLWHFELPETAAAAAAGGHLNILAWAVKNGCKCMDQTCKAAAAEGHLDVLVWAAAREHGWAEGERVLETITFAIFNARVPILQWLLEQLGSDLLRKGWRQAESLGFYNWSTAIRSIELLQWGRAHAGADFASAKLCSIAAEHCCLDTLQWLRRQGCPWDAETAACACSMQACIEHPERALDLLSWAHENGCPWDERTCQAAGAHCASLQLLDYLKRHDCPGADTVCLAASEQGELETLKWALEVGFPWDPAECEEKARHPLETDSSPRHAEVVKWIQEQRRE